jgi:hypothetical protein
MYIIVVGGGRVGFYLSKELLEAGHEIVVLEKNERRARQIADELGSIVLARDGCEGKHLAEAGANRAAIVAAVTGDDEDNLVICQMAKHHFQVPRTIARVNNPKNEDLFRHLGVDEVISPTGWRWARSSRTSPSTRSSTWPSWAAARWSCSRRRSRPIRRHRPPAGGHPAAGRLLALRPVRGDQILQLRGDTSSRRATRCWRSRAPSASSTCAAS